MVTLKRVAVAAALAGGAGAVLSASLWAGARLAAWWPGPEVDRQMVRWLPLGAVVWGAFLAATWWLRRQALERQSGAVVDRPRQPGDLDVTVGYTDRGPVVIPQNDRFLHTLVVGTTGTGKSSRVLKPLIWQDLQALAAGKPVGLTVIEPKGDLVADVAEMCEALGVPYTLVDPEREDTARFNPLDGDPDVAAEVMRTVLAAMFGKQDAFFSQVQQTLTQYTIRMLKELDGDRVTLPDVLTVLMDPHLLRQRVDEYRLKNGDLLVIRFFEAEVLGRLAEKFYQFALGVRVQMGDIVGNRMLRRVLTGQSNVDLDRHLAEGGVLLVNTAMGRLGKLGDAFGKFVMLHMQYAVFRRPGRERDRRPHVLYIDEFPRYLNEDFERMLALGRSFRCATVLACQSTSQLVLEAKPQLREILLGNCRNKILLNLDDAADAERFSRELGEEEVEVESWTYKRVASGPFVWQVADSKRVDSKRERRFTPDALLHLPRFTAVVKVTVDGQPQRAVACRLELSEFDRHRAKWQKRRDMGTDKVVTGPERATDGAQGPGTQEAQAGEQAGERVPLLEPSASQDVLARATVADSPGGGGSDEVERTAASPSFFPQAAVSESRRRSSRREEPGPSQARLPL